jgi:tetratricopeptide (TPR) repeat protein
MNAPELEKLADAAAANRDFPSALKLIEQAVAQGAAGFETLIKLSALRRAAGDSRGALAALDLALAQSPLDFTALLMRATHLESLGRTDEAGVTFGRALAQAPRNPPQPLIPVLKTAQTKYAAWQGRQADYLRAVAGSPSPMLDRLITNAVRLTAPDRVGSTHYCYPGLAEIPFHDRARFPWLCALETATDTIEAEFAALIASQAAALVPYIQYSEGAPVAQWAELNHNRDWTAIHLIEHGEIKAANADHCPQTMALLRALPQPEIRAAGPNAMFSLLAPHTHIPPHTGITNTRLVCHLPLIVPDGCWFRVGGETREWNRGEAWIFDDTIEHEAMNPSDQLRVILIVDLWHPDLSAEERAGISAIIGAGGQVHGL